MIVALTACASLAACGAFKGAGINAPWRPDIAACESQASSAPNVETQSKRLAFIDNCMVAKGWRPSKGCVETQYQGTNFCEYSR
jgi:hypothetical protein